MKIKKLLGMAAIAVVTFAGCSAGNGNTAERNDTAETVIENIMTRTSVRNFTDQSIGGDTLEVLVKAGMAAPTAINSQPWAFVIVTDRAVLDSLMSVHPYSNLKTAAAAIIVCGDMEKALDGAGRDYWIQDCSAATENILLAAHACGLGAVWCGVYPNPERIPGVKRVLALPDAVMPLNIITLGHPASDNAPKDKWNPSNVHYQQW